MPRLGAKWWVGSHGGFPRRKMSGSLASNLIRTRRGLLMWTTKNRAKYNRDGLRYPSDLTDDEWGHIEPLIPPAKRGGRKRGSECAGSGQWHHVCAEHRVPMAVCPR